LTLQAPLRRTVVSAALVALAAAAAPVAAAGPVAQAVVTFDGRPVTVPGVRVVSSLPRLRMQVVRGDAGALARLAGEPGVRGLAPDDAVDLSSDDDEAGSGAVLASAALGGDAGRPGAGAGVRVAIVDTGVSDTPALNRASGRLVDAVDTSTGTNETGGVYTDGYGHGTFMASIVAGGAVTGTEGHPLGVAPAATVLVVRVARQDGTTSLSRVLGGLEWVARHADQVDVANLSLSHRRPEREYGADPLTDAVELVQQAGVEVVVSSGNRRSEVGDPGFDPKVLTVGAADLDRSRVAHFSGSAMVQGIRKPDVVASGVHVLGLLPTGSLLDQDPRTAHLADGLYRGTGTSQATAITSGLAALVLAAHPDATPTQVKAAIRCAASDLPGLRDGAGLVHATTELCAGPDGQALDGSGDATGEAGFDAGSWGAGSWGAGSWGAGSWGAGSWGAGSWGAGSWGAGSWGAGSWGAGSWGAGSWGAGSWGAGSWGAGSWASDSFGNDDPDDEGLEP
jgi:serine protease AprX